MRITTPRLVLREFVAGDWPAVLAYQREPLYLRYGARTGRSEAEVQQHVQELLDQQAEQPRRRFRLAITLRESGRLIGSCAIRRAAANEWEADIGYDLAPDTWGNGYATEAARAMVDFGFQEWALHRVSSWCIADNTGSARVLERVGLRLEGRLRENEYFKGRWWDTLLYGMLAGDWKDSGTAISRE